MIYTNKQEKPKDDVSFIFHGEIFKDKFKTFSVQHGYRASYNVNAFRSNLNTTPTDANGNFYASKLISNVNLAEQFNPLVKVDMTLKNSIKLLAEIKKDRTLNMSFDNNLLTEVSGNEYIIGLGELGSIGIIYSVFVYVKVEDYANLKYSLNEEIKLKFEANGIHIPIG